MVDVDPEQAELARDVVAPTAVNRTVEGDLGMRWSAVSTVEEAELTDLAEGTVLGGAEHRTTLVTDVLDGYDACLAQLAGIDGRATEAEVLACSSAGGGLRIAVVGNEELVTAEAGRRVALSSGGKVVSVRAVAQGHDLDHGVHVGRGRPGAGRPGP